MWVTAPTSIERVNMTEEVKTVSARDKLRPLSDKEWLEVSQLVPALGEMRDKCRSQRVSPTGALGTVLASIGLYLEVGTRLEPFNSKKPLPISNYVALVATPGLGKSDSLGHSLPPLSLIHI